MTWNKHETQGLTFLCKKGHKTSPKWKKQWQKMLLKYKKEKLKIKIIEKIKKWIEVERLIKCVLILYIEQHSYIKVINIVQWFTEIYGKCSETKKNPEERLW